jgi:Leucine Rich repeat
MEEQQQQQRTTHTSSILNAIARLSDPQYREERHKLRVHGHSSPTVDRRSWQHLVDFLDNGDNSHEVVMTELELCAVELSEPSDGSLQVLQRFFSRSDTSLKKVTLWSSDFGSAQETSRLLEAFHTNRTVTDLTIKCLGNLERAALGNSLSNLMQNMPLLLRLDCSYNTNLQVTGVRALLPALQANRTLRELDLSFCLFADEGIRILADALAGNTTMEALKIDGNSITPIGLDDITRILESTQLKKITLWRNFGVFANAPATQRFASVLSRHQFLKELDLAVCHLNDGGLHLIVDGLVGNTIMEAVDITHNNITSRGLVDITRLLESMQLKTLYVEQNSHEVYNDTDTTQYFVSTLRRNATVQEMLSRYTYEGRNIRIPQEIVTIMDIVCARNKSLANVALLLAPPPPPPQQHQQQQQQQGLGTSTLFLIKTWHKAITKFAMAGPRGGNAGASAIFKLFTARPQLLEKRIKRPPPVASAAVAAASAIVTDSLDNCSTSNSIQASSSSSSSSSSAINSNSQSTKRQRL